ncbi:MAG: hypothetical protein DHS80DRAFT_23117 [Piptocephalis tieghemiana]|nr:MAG: hypothetical protein DHS80DRAFT_23117 [Piptocephalis tieghemiana]
MHLERTFLLVVIITILSSASVTEAGGFTEFFSNAFKRVIPKKTPSVKPSTSPPKPSTVTTSPSPKAPSVNRFSQAAGKAGSVIKNNKKIVGTVAGLGILGGGLATLHSIGKNDNSTNGVIDDSTDASNAAGGQGTSTEGGNGGGGMNSAADADVPSDASFGGSNNGGIASGSANPSAPVTGGGGGPSSDDSNFVVNNGVLVPSDAVSNGVSQGGPTQNTGFSQQPSSQASFEGTNNGLNNQPQQLSVNSPQAPMNIQSGTRNDLPATSSGNALSGSDGTTLQARSLQPDEKLERGGDDNGTAPSNKPSPDGSKTLPSDQVSIMGEPSSPPVSQASSSSDPTFTGKTTSGRNSILSDENEKHEGDDHATPPSHSFGSPAHDLEEGPSNHALGFNRHPRIHTHNGYPSIPSARRDFMYGGYPGGYPGGYFNFPQDEPFWMRRRPSYLRGSPQFAYPYDLGL